MIVPKKDYLGDGCYIEFDGMQFILTTSNGMYDTNKIYLEPGMISALNEFIESCKGD